MKDDWKNMASAPKDGKMFLACVNGKVVPCHYEDQKYNEKPRPFWNYAAYGSGNYVTECRKNPPIAWMELPKPCLTAPDGYFDLPV